MAIKLVTTEQEKEPRPKYPYFGMHRDGSIVFFSSKDTGVMMSVCEAEDWPDDYHVGYYSSAWHEPNFTPIEGVITFQNEF